MTYKATGGITPSDQTKIHTVDLMLATNSGSLERTAFILDGWNTATDGSGSDYAEGSLFTANAAITLYAKWIQELDFGDAPAPYPMLLADNGARHIIVPGYFLGTGGRCRARRLTGSGRRCVKSVCFRQACLT